MPAPRCQHGQSRGGLYPASAITRQPPVVAGFTLVEVLVATSLTLILVGAAVSLFATLTQDVSGSRAIIETHDRLRATQERLRLDLRSLTAPTLPPLQPGDGLGYFQYYEGAATDMAPAVDFQGNPDSTVGDLNDRLMFTARSQSEPFVGLLGGTTSTSQLAEIAWFVRGNTLFRRVLLIVPSATASIDANGDGRITAADLAGQNFFARHDVSIRQEGGPYDNRAGALASGYLVPNTLADLTIPANRFGHLPWPVGLKVDHWGQLGLPVLRECSDADWPYPLTDPLPSGGVTASQGGYSIVLPRNVPFAGVAVAGNTDYWNAPHTQSVVDARSGSLFKNSGAPGVPYNGLRVAEDVILTNVLAFDVRAWDPTAPVYVSGGITLAPGDPGYASASGTPASYGAFVDLNYAGANGNSAFSGPGNPASGVSNLYDTWSTHFERDGIDQNSSGVADEGSDGIDNDGNNGVDDAVEMEVPPPYAVPLRGIMVRIRVFEPDSRQIREVTIVQSLLPE